MIEELLERLIQIQLDFLKPEIKEKFVSSFTDGGQEGIWATTMKSFNPPVVTFHLNEMKKPVIDFIRQVISHEIIHCFQPLSQEWKEKEAYNRQDKLKFFVE